MPGLMQRIFRRRASGSSGRGASGLLRRLPSGALRGRAAGLRRRLPSRLFGGGAAKSRLPWGKQALQQSQQGTHDTAVVVPDVSGEQPSFRDRGQLRRRLRYLRRARELAFRDIGGLMFDMRRFGRERPDLVEAKLGALAAVDQELRALERVLDDRRPLHQLREPGITSCARCGALHSSESNFCPNCGLQIAGPRAMGEVGGAIAAPPTPPPAPIEQGAGTGQHPAAPAAPLQEPATPAVPLQEPPPPAEGPQTRPQQAGATTPPEPLPDASSHPTETMLPPRGTDQS